MKQNSKVSIIVTIGFLVLITIYATYAFLNSTVDINNLDISANINGPLTFTAVGGNTFRLNVDVSQMDESKVGNVVASATDNMTVTLETDGMEGICCSYDIVWEWDETDTVRNRYRKSEGAIDEYTISGNITESYMVGGLETSFSHSNPVFKTQVPDYNSVNLANRVYKATICNNTKSLTTKAVQNYTYNINFYNLNVAQDNFRGVELASKITVDNVVCKKQVTLSEEVLAQVQEKDHSSSQDGSIYKVAHETVEYEGKTLDAGVRYEGKDPDNYITFNGETAGWRIIGVFEGSTIGLEPGKQYTKIIRNTRISSYEWDKGQVSENLDDVYDEGEPENDWANSTLNAYLNGTYLSSMIDANKIAKYNGQYSTWYLRGTSNYTNLYSQDWYVTERYTGQPGYRNGTQYAADTETKGAIGLMYPSDYGFGAYGTNCDNKTTNTLSNYGTLEDLETMEVSGCAGVDWLATDSINNTDWEWLMSPSPDLSLLAFYVFGSDGVGNERVDIANAVRPTLYLEDTVTITGGNGSSSSPYLLDMPAKTLSDTVLAQESAKDYISSQDSSVYKITHETVEYNSQTLDAGIRYEGKDPDNYITFNGETAGWRIIGVFEGSTIGLEPGKQYTKIVRDSSIGDHTWDTATVEDDWDNVYDQGETESDWVNSSLNSYLNGTYLSSLSMGNKIAKYNGQYSTWYLRSIDESTLGNIYTSEMYMAERIKGQTGYRNGVQYAADAETKAAMGLMYPSDYGYAAYGTNCDNKTTNSIFVHGNYDYETGEVSGCAAVNYLANYSLKNQMNEWLISPLVNRYDLSLAISYSVPVGVTVRGVYATAAVRPTLYLSSDIMITGGTGSKTNPYVLE